MSVAKLCNPEVVSIGAQASLADAARVMRNFHVGALVVVERSTAGTRPVGIITDRDIVVEVIAQELDPHALTVTDIMIRELETIHASADFWEAIDRMRATGVRRLPVVDDDGHLAGILTLDDALDIIGQGLRDLGDVVLGELDQEKRVTGS